MIWAGYGLDLVSALRSQPNVQSIVTNTSTGTRTVSPTGITRIAATPIITSSQLFSAAMSKPVQEAAQAASILSILGGGKAPSASTPGASTPSIVLGGGSSPAPAQSGAAPSIPTVPAAPVAATSEFQQKCVSAGGQWAGDGCLLPDGAKVVQTADGGVGCLNQVGVCAGQPLVAGAAASGGAGSAMMIGAAALAALLFLK
jgi:hypothetical protein